jgi:hypothetical protein
VQINRHTIRESCQVDLAREETVDWLLHSEGPIELVGSDLLTTSGPLGEGAYAFIELVGRADVAGRAALVAPGLRLEIESDASLELLIGRCPGSAARPAKKRWVLVARRHARSTRYLATFELEEKG